jgi:hypothetical protein
MAPTLTLIVLSLGRPLRLHWLLCALGADDGVEVLELRRFAGLDAAVRAAGAPSVALLAEDLVPAPGWLARARAAAPGALVQGAVACDPAQEDVLHATPDLEALAVAPPARWAPAVNLVAPRDALASLAAGLPAPVHTAAGGAALLARAAEAGVPVTADGALLAWSSPAVPGPERGGAATLRRHPELRGELRLRVFTRGAHARLLLAGAGLALAPWGVPLLAPWALRQDPRDRSRQGSILRLPARTARDARSLVVAMAEAARERTLVL